MRRKYATYNDPLDIRPEFGQMLRELRNRNEISVAKLAQRVGLDHTYLSRLELGARMPGRLVLEAIVQNLILTKEEIDTLYYLAGYIPPSLEHLGEWPKWMTKLCRSMADADTEGAPDTMAAS